MQAIELGDALIMPRHAMARFRIARVGHERLVLEGGRRLFGKLVGDLLSPAQEIVVVACTIGAALEERVRDLMRDDPVLALSLDTFGSLAVERLVTETFEEIRNLFEPSGMQLSMPVFPGHEGWPLAVGQQQIFRLIDATTAGIRLNDNMQMIPHKSVSFVLGVGAGFDATGVPCDYCGVRATCDRRHAA